MEKLTEEYNRLDIEAGKYNRSEFDIVYKIIEELVKDRTDVGDNGNLALPLVTGHLIDEALERSGFSTDEKFVSDFKKYREIEQQAREIQLRYLMQGGGEKDSRLQKIIDDVIEQEKDKNPYFPCVAPFTDLGMREEYLDELLESVKFDISGSLTEYIKELVSFKIDLFLNSVGIEAKWITDLIEKHITIIKENTDKPLFTQNKITETLKICDQSPYVGQITQILFLQGLVKWFEHCEFDKNVHDDVQNILDGICERLMEVTVFYFSRYYGKETLFDNYLASTELGKLCIECQDEQELSNTEDGPIPDEENIFIELITQIQELCTDTTELKDIKALVQTGVNKDNKVVLKADTRIEAMLNVFMPIIDTNIFSIHIKDSDSQKEKARYLHTLFNVFTEGSIKKDISRYHGKGKK